MDPYWLAVDEIEPGLFNSGVKNTTKHATMYYYYQGTPSVSCPTDRVCPLQLPLAARATPIEYSWTFW